MSNRRSERELSSTVFPMLREIVSNTLGAREINTARSLEEVLSGCNATVQHLDKKFIGRLQAQDWHDLFTQAELKVFAARNASAIQKQRRQELLLVLAEIERIASLPEAGVRDELQFNMLDHMAVTTCHDDIRAAGVMLRSLLDYSYADFPEEEANAKTYQLSAAAIQAQSFVQARKSIALAAESINRIGLTSRRAVAYVLPEVLEFEKHVQDYARSLGKDCDQDTVRDVLDQLNCLDQMPFINDAKTLAQMVELADTLETMADNSALADDLLVSNLQHTNIKVSSENTAAIKERFANSAFCLRRVVDFLSPQDMDVSAVRVNSYRVRDGMKYYMHALPEVALQALQLDTRKKLQSRVNLFRRARRATLRQRLDILTPENSTYLQFLPEKIKLPTRFMPTSRRLAKQLNALREQWLNAMLSANQSGAKLSAAEMSSFQAKYTALMQKLEHTLDRSDKWYNRLIHYNSRQILNNAVANYNIKNILSARSSVISSAQSKFYNSEAFVAKAFNARSFVEGLQAGLPEDSWLSARDAEQAACAKKVYNSIAQVQMYLPDLLRSLMTLQVQNLSNKRTTDPLVTTALNALQKFAGSEFVLGKGLDSDFNKVFFITRAQLASMRANGNKDQKAVDDLCSALKKLSDSPRYAQLAEPLYRAVDTMLGEWTCLRNMQGAYDNQTVLTPNAEHDAQCYAAIIDGADTRFSETGIANNTVFSITHAQFKTMLQQDMAQLQAIKAGQDDSASQYFSVHKKIQATLSGLINNLCLHKSNLLDARHGLDATLLRNVQHTEMMIIDYQSLFRMLQEKTYAANLHLHKQAIPEAVDTDVATAASADQAVLRQRQFTSKRSDSNAMRKAALINAQIRFGDAASLEAIEDNYQRRQAEQEERAMRAALARYEQMHTKRRGSAKGTLAKCGILAAAGGVVSKTVPAVGAAATTGLHAAGAALHAHPVVACAAGAAAVAAAVISTNRQDASEQRRSPSPEDVAESEAVHVSGNKQDAQDRNTSKPSF